MSPTVMNHPDPADLTAVAAGLLEAGAATDHIAGCAECSRKVADAKADFERIGRALESPVPAAVERRASRLMTPRRAAAWWVGIAASVAVAALGATVGVLYRRIASLEERMTRMAAPERAPEVVSPHDALALADVIRQACAPQIDQRALEVAEAAGLADDQAHEMRHALARAAEESTRQLGRYLAGELRAEELAGRDLLATLDRELGRGLASVIPEIERRQAQAAANLVHGTTEELCRELGVSEAQCDRIRSSLLRAIGDRRDLAFLPGPMLDVIRRIELTSDRGWKSAIVSELTEDQKPKFETYARAQKAADEEVRTWFRSQIRKS